MVKIKRVEVCSRWMEPLKSVVVKETNQEELEDVTGTDNRDTLSLSATNYVVMA